jgi:predicted nucleic acid-binding protein
MKIVLDTSVVIALLASDEERDGIIHGIHGYDIVCPESIKPEIGNAVSAMFKRGRITLVQGLAIVEGFQQLDIQIVSLNLIRATEMSHQYQIYAYDAYVLECAERLNTHLVTLDDRMKEIAQKIGISLIEV